MNRTNLGLSLLIMTIISCSTDSESTTDGGIHAATDDASSHTIWQEPTSGITWMDPPATTGMSWQDGIDYCDDLVLDGKDDWRLPTLDEFRAMIRGCPETETDGLCPLGDGSGYDEMTLDCSGCEKNQGPHDQTGGYYDSQLSGISMDYWTSSTDTDREGYAWSIFFVEGAITSKQNTLIFQVRCGRGP